MDRAFLIYNPTSGRENITLNLETIREKLNKENYETTVYETKKPGDAILKASLACLEYDTIIVAGGDGTLHEVVNGLAFSRQHVKLGIIPGGTSNDFAKALQIPLNAMEACKVIGRRNIKEVDLGHINHKIFINIAAGGILTGVSYEVPSKLKTYFGHLAYYAKGLEKLPHLKPAKLKINTPGFSIEDEFMLFLVANSKSVGGFEHLAPKAKINDGFLDLIAVKQVNIGEFFGLVTKLIRGHHTEHPKVIYKHTQYVDISSREIVPLNTDGEYAGNLPCTIRVLPKHLKVLTP